jgi:uncharacterized protein YbjT (DUF2867 family)
MRIAVTTPTGHIGSQLCRCLLEAGQNLVLLARDQSKVQDFQQHGAQVKQGSLDDAAFVTQATAGCDALFWLSPHDMKSNDPRGFDNRCGKAAAAAIRANRIPRVVNISSVGAQLDRGTGPISGLHDVEQVLDAACQNVTHLRPGFFFENFLWQVKSMQESSSIFMPVDGSIPLPMIATKDIAAAACKVLQDQSWQGRQVRGLHGPADLTLNEAAKQISRGAGQNIRYVKVSDDQARKAMQAMGMSNAAIDWLLEMYRSFNSGLCRPAEPRTSETTTPTTLEQFARQVIAPMLARQQAAAG